MYDHLLFVKNHGERLTSFGHFFELHHSNYSIFQTFPSNTDHIYEEKDSVDMSKHEDP